MSLILFDLDGTLIDSEPGIFSTLDYAFAQIGAQLPPPEVLRSWIGPPFWQSFPSVLGDDHARIEAAIEHYRIRFEQVGWSQHRVYPGIAELVDTLVRAQHALAIVTTKPQPQARTIIDHLPFGTAFTRVYGASISGRHCAKAEMIAQALADFSADASDAVMIGDRYFDIEGAKRQRRARYRRRLGFWQPRGTGTSRCRRDCQGCCGTGRVTVVASDGCRSCAVIPACAGMTADFGLAVGFAIRPA